MIEEEGIVVKKLDGGLIQVVVERKDACGSCPSKGACTMLADTKDMLVEARDEAGAEVGERVVLSQKPKTLLKASFVAYIWPLMGLLAGVVVGKKLSELFGVNPELLMPLSGLVGAALAFYIIYLSRKSFAASGDYTPTATRIIP